jgi:steroid 5-alpha reductase family enzyme
MPVLIVLLAIVFNLLNSYVNARWISHFGAYASDWLTDPRFLIGVAVFALGFVINFRADSVLFRLRKPGETGYKIPKGGLHDLVVSPNYFGEIVEWIGWAVLTWSTAGLSFAVYTVANLAPRALSHLRWYREEFPEFPRERRALLPWVW